MYLPCYGRWLKAILRVERTVGEPLERALHSDTYFELVAGVKRTVSRFAGTTEPFSREALHLMNMPAFTTCAACASSWPGSSASSRASRRSSRTAASLGAAAADRERLPGACRRRSARLTSSSG
jgi:hypothetical protein